MSQQNNNLQQILISLDRHSESQQQLYKADTFNSSLNLQNSQVSNSNLSNPYQQYFSKRKEKQQNQSKNNQLLEAKKFLSAKSAQNIGFFPQTYADNNQVGGSVLSQAHHSNLVTSLSLASVNSVNSQNQNQFPTNNQMNKLNIRQVNGSNLQGNQQFSSYHAIIAGPHTSTKKYNLGKTGYVGTNEIGKLLIKGNYSRNGQFIYNVPGSQSLDEIENQKIKLQNKNQFQPVSQRLATILQKNEYQQQQNNIFSSNRSSQSIKKSPLNNNIATMNTNSLSNIQYMKKRDSSCQDTTIKTFQPLQDDLSNTKTKLVINDIEMVQNKFVKLSPKKSQKLSLGGIKNSMADETQINTQNQANLMKVNNSTSSTNQSSSQIFGRNKKNESVLSCKVAKGNQGQMAYMHQSSMNKLEQIKNIYSLQDKIPTKHQLSSEYTPQPQSALDSINGGYDETQMHNCYKNSQRNNKILTISKINSVYQNNSGQIKEGQLSLSKISNNSSNNPKNQTPGSLKNEYFKGVLLSQSILQNSNNIQILKQEKIGSIISPINGQKSSFKTSNIQKSDFNSSKCFQNQQQKFIIINKQQLSQKQQVFKKQSHILINGNKNVTMTNVLQNDQNQKKLEEQTKNSKQQSIQNQSDNQSKKNSYYNTKSSFGIRQSSCYLPPNSSHSKQQDFQQIKINGKQANNPISNTTLKGLKNQHLNTQKNIKINNLDQNTIIKSNKIKQGPDLNQQNNNSNKTISNQQIQNNPNQLIEQNEIQNSKKLKHQQNQQDKMNQKQNQEQSEFEEYKTQETKQNDLLDYPIQQSEQTDQKEVQINSFKKEINENNTYIKNNTLIKKLQYEKSIQQYKNQEDQTIEKEQEYLKEINSTNLINLEFSDPQRQTANFQNNKEINDLLVNKIPILIPNKVALASLNRENLKSSTNCIMDSKKMIQNQFDSNLDQSNIGKEGFSNSSFLNLSECNQSNILKSQAQYTKTKLNDNFEYQLNQTNNKSYEVSKNENFKSKKLFKTPNVGNKKSYYQNDMQHNNQYMQQNSAKSSNLRTNIEKLPDIFRNNVKMQSKSEQKLITVNNNITENSSKKHQKSHDQLEIMRHDNPSADKYNEKLNQGSRKANLSRGENLKFESKMQIKMNDIKSDNSRSLSPSGLLSSEQIQKTKINKLQYNELIKINADIKKNNVRKLNDQLSKIGQQKLQTESNSLCYQNDKSNDSINYQIMNDEEEQNQIQNYSYDSIHPNNNVNDSFESYSNKILPTHQNNFTKKILKHKLIKDLQNSNLPILKNNENENQSQSSIEKQNKQVQNVDSQFEQKDQNSFIKQQIINDQFNKNGSESLIYKDLQNKGPQFEINQKIKKENNIKDERQGTANTHGGYMRQNYKQKQKLDYNIQDSSLQCQSEIVNLNFEQNNSVINHNLQQISYLDHIPVCNLNSDFEKSFEIMDPLNFNNSEFYYPNKLQQNNLNIQFQEHNSGQNEQNINIDIGNYQFSHQTNIVNLLNQQNSMAIGSGVITDEMSSIPSIHSIPVVRNQKSQATYRHGHQKISDVLNKYYHNNYGNSSIQQINNLGLSDTSQSEIYRNFQNIQQSQASAPLMAAHLNQEIYSQLNNQQQINTTQISQLSHGSEMGAIIDVQNYQRHLGTKQEAFRNKKRQTDGKDGALSGDDRHPFNGPKLHLFRKGQSKSSQAKLRKIKKSQQNIQFNEINSQAIFSQQYINQNNNIQNGLNDSHQNLQNNVGQDNYQDLTSQKYENELNNNVSNELLIKNQPIIHNHNQNNGHINISEILNGKIKLQPPNQYYEQNQINTYLGSRESFQSRLNEIDSDPQYSQECNNYMEINQQLLEADYQNSGFKTSNEINLESNQINIQALNVQQFNDSDSQQCRSQFTTICQKTTDLEIDDFQDQRTANRIIYQEDKLAHLQKNAFQNRRFSENTSSEVKLRNNNSNLKTKIQGPNINNNLSNVIKQYSQERLQDTEVKNNELNTSYKANSSFKPGKVQNQQGQNFQHPKVGKSSKHPQVFRNKITQHNTQKNTQSNYKANNDNHQNLKSQIINLTFNNNFPKEIYHSKSHKNLLQEQDNIDQQMSPSFKFQLNDKNISKSNFQEFKDYQHCLNNFNQNKDNKEQKINNSISQQELDIQSKQQQVICSKEQNSIFTTTFDGFNQDKEQIKKTQNANQDLDDQKGFNVQKYSNANENSQQVDQDQVQIKIKFNENFGCQNNDLSKSQIKKSTQQNKSDGNQNEKEIDLLNKVNQKEEKQKKATNLMNQTMINISKAVNQNESIRKDQIVNSRNKSGELKIEEGLIKPVDQNQNQSRKNQENEGSRIETNNDVNNLNNTQKSYSIAQTPCFAETPNTTDQFKGYKIDVSDC